MSASATLFLLPQFSLEKLPRGDRPPDAAEGSGETVAAAVASPLVGSSSVTAREIQSARSYLLLLRRHGRRTTPPPAPRIPASGTTPTLSCLVSSGWSRFDLILLLGSRLLREVLDLGFGRCASGQSGFIWLLGVHEQGHHADAPMFDTI